MAAIPRNMTGMAIKMSAAGYGIVTIVPDGEIVHKEHPGVTQESP